MRKLLGFTIALALALPLLYAFPTPARGEGWGGCAKDQAPVAAVVAKASEDDWALRKLDDAQLEAAISVYNKYPPDTIARENVTGAYVGVKDGQPMAFLFFSKGACTVGGLLHIGPDVYAQIMRARGA